VGEQSEGKALTLGEQVPKVFWYNLLHQKNSAKIEVSF